MTGVAKYNGMMSHLTRPPAPKTQVANLVDDLEPGPLKDELQDKFDPSQETYEEYLQRKGLGERPFNAANGGSPKEEIVEPPQSMQVDTTTRGIGDPLEDFKQKADRLLQGSFASTNKEFFNSLIQKEYDKALDAGVQPQEALSFLQERSQMYRTLADEGRRQGEPAILGPSYGRENKAFGTEPNEFNNQPPLSLEESTTGPGGFPMTAGLNILKLPQTVDKAVDLIDAGKVGLRDAKNIVKNFFDKRDVYSGATKVGTSTKKDYTKDKDFLKVFNKFKNKYFKGNTMRTNAELGLPERFAKDLELRVFKSEGIDKASRKKNKLLFYEPVVKEPETGIMFRDLTTSMKSNPQKYLKLKVAKDSPNRFLDQESLGHLLGLKFKRTDTGIRVGSGKDQYDQLGKQLTDLGVRRTNQGLFDVNDAINKIVEKSKTKLVKGERKSEMGAGRYNLEKKFDPNLFKVRADALRRINNRAKDLDLYIPRSVDDLGHPYSLSKSEEKYKKLFKNSNMNGLNTLVYQDPLINRELFKNSGYEAKYDRMFKDLSKIQNKKITPKIQEQLLEIKKDLNENYNFVKNIIANPKELSKYVPENTDSKFINYLSKSHGDRIQKIDINIPEIGDTFKSEDVFVDMSTVNPKYIMGYVNNINPKAKKFKDLSLSEQELYKNNLLMQNAEIVSDFAKKAGGTAEEAEELREGISMGFDEVGRRKYKDGTPQQPESEEIDNLKKSFLKMKDELDSDKNPKSLIKSLETEMKDIAAFGQKYGGDVLGKVGRVTTGIDLPIFQTLFASTYDIEQDSPVWLTLPAAFTDEVANIFKLYDKSEGRFGLGKVKDFGKFLASSLVPQKFLGKAIRSPLFKAVSKVGKATSMAAPLTETAVEAYRFKKMKDARDDAIRQFDIPIEIANKGFDDYIRSTIPKDAFDELNVPASPGLPKFKRGLQEFASMFGLADSPYEDPRGYPTAPFMHPMLLKRQGLDEGGPPDPKRRMILKMLGLIPAGIAGLASLRFGPKKVAKVVEAAKGMPEWFGALVDKVIKTGKDATKRFATKDREEVFEKFMGEEEGVRVYRDLETGDTRVEYFSPDNMGGSTSSVDMVYKAPQQLEDGTTVPSDFRAIEAEPRGIRSGPDDYDIEFDGENVVENIDDLNSDLGRLEFFATDEMPTLKQIEKSNEKKRRVQKINENQVEQAEYLETKYGPGEPGDPYVDYSDYD